MNEWGVMQNLGPNCNNKCGYENRLCEDLVMTSKWQRELEKTKPHT